MVYACLMYLQHSVTPPTANDSENYSKHTCLIQYLSLSVFVMHACMDMYVRQAIELRVLLFIIIMSVCYKGVLLGMELSCTHYLL